MLFENVNDEGMRRRRCIWRQSIGHPAYVLGSEDLGADAQCACQNLRLSGFRACFRIRTAISQLESLILAQNERWRQA